MGHPREQGGDGRIVRLYLELVRDRLAAITQATDGDSSLREQLRSAWFGFALRHPSNPDASNFIRQCDASRVLAAETRARQAELEAGGRTNYARAVDRGIIWEMPVRVFHALCAEPIFGLAHRRDRHDMEIDDKELHLAFEGVCRSVLRNPE